MLKQIILLGEGTSNAGLGDRDHKRSSEDNEDGQTTFSGDGSPVAIKINQLGTPWQYHDPA